MNGKVVVIFVEGQTDEVFYDRICKHIQSSKKGKPNKFIIKNIKGIGNYNNKAPAKFKHEIKPKYDNCDFIVFCAYDSDVFNIPRQKKPPVDWNEVELKLKSCGAGKVFHIIANEMIEDWFLIDLEGICKALNIKNTRRINGKNGYEKMQNLFRKGFKVYQKGYNTNQFVNKLDINKIHTKLEDKFKDLKNC